MPLLSETPPKSIETQSAANFSVDVADGGLTFFPLYYPDPQTLTNEILQTLSPNEWVLFAYGEADEIHDLPAGFSMIHIDPKTGHIPSENLPGGYVTSIMELMTTAESYWATINPEGAAHLRLISIPEHKMDVVWLKATERSHEDRFFLKDTFKRWGGDIVDFSTTAFVKAVNEEHEKQDAMYRRMAAEGYDISQLGG